MSFQDKTQEQQLLLARNMDNLQQGQMMTIIITQSPGACSLEFKHASDTAWNKHPDFDGTPSASGVVIQTIVCPSATMRLNFDAPPGADYHVSIVWHTNPDY